MKDKVVVVTGSTSGIGHGMALKFAKEGAKLVIHGLVVEESVKEFSHNLLSLGASEVIYERADISKPAEIDLMFENIINKYQKIDILINNAGMQFVSPIEDFPAEKWEMIMRVDLIASFYTIKNVLPLMKKQNWGRIVNIASAHALVASPFKSAYVAAKHGMVGLTKTVALEAAQFGITVNAVCPGYVETALVLGQIAATAKAKLMSEEDVIKNIILGAQATKKFVKINEIAEFVYFLCSDSAASITGAALSIDGGWTSS